MFNETTNITITYFIIVFIISAIVEKVFKLSNKNVYEDDFLKNIKEYKADFILQIVASVVCIVFSFMFKDSVYELSKAAFEWMILISIMPDSAKKARKASDDRYGKIIPMFEYMHIAGFLAIIFMAMNMLNSFFNIMIVLIAVIVLSIIRINELNKIEQKY